MASSYPFFFFFFLLYFLDGGDLDAICCTPVALWCVCVCVCGQRCFVISNKAVMDCGVQPF